jgi:hypothetical protein
MTDFVVRGPYDITPYKGKRGRHIGTVEGRSFFETCDGLGSERGCYVFATRAGRGYTPWYVGKATKSFKQECFTSHKLTKYNECLVDRVRGTPVLFFVVACKARGITGAKHIKGVEDFLIQTAMAANPDLLNIRGTRKEGWTISGIIRSRGRSSEVAGSFKRMFKMR